MSIRLRMEPWGRSYGGYSPSTFARDESALRVHLLPALGAEGSDRWTLVMSVASLPTGQGGWHLEPFAGPMEQCGRPQLRRRNRSDLAITSL